MVLILSKNYLETTTEEVMDWLHYNNCTFLRLNGEIFEEVAIQASIGKNCCFSIPHKKLENVNKIWNRRWWVAESLDLSFKSGLSSETLYYFNKYLRNEYFDFSAYFFSRFKKKSWVDDKRVINSFNKLTTLSTAEELGIKIPNTIVTNDLKTLNDFLFTNKRIITKPISNVVGFDYDNGSFTLETREVKAEDLDKFPKEHFFISLFQQLVEKKYELRIFYLNNKFYSMAIFSQRREGALIDYRMYDFQQPDRMVPYILSSSIKRKLQKLVNLLKLKHCSIDCIVSNDNDIYFLEVNPVGQFGMVSKPCNYYLEKKMASYLKS